MSDRPENLNPERTIFERRRFVRVDGTFVVSYSDITAQQQKTDISQTKNISVGGILFTTDREFPVETVLRVRLRLPETPDYINVKVKVVDSKQRVKGMMYDTRVKFISIKLEDRDAVRKIVEYRLREQKEH